MKSFKPIYVTAVTIAALSLGACGSSPQQGAKQTITVASTTHAVSPVPATTAAASTPVTTVEAAPNPTPNQPPVNTTATASEEFANALKSAQEYNRTEPISYKELYERLTSQYCDNFSPEAAQYAVDNLGVDWNENALKAAKNYKSATSMSPEEIHDQLTSDVEQFTSKQADYAIAHLND